MNTNRVRLLDQTAAGTAETGYCYDSADRILGTVGAAVVSGVKYDSHGNTTEFASGGSTTYLSWDAADRNLGARSVGGDPADVAYQRDAMDRIVRRGASQGDQLAVALYGFTGSGDTADFVLDADKKVVTRSISLPGGVLLTIGSSSRSFDHPTVRGDLSLSTGADGKQVGDLRTFTPFGEPLKADGVVDPDNVPDNMPGQMDNGWLGQHQRLYEHAGALSFVQMGARPYSPLLSRFLSVDPVEGGSANDYDYVNGDPINTTDLDGRWSFGGFLKKAGSVINGAARAVGSAARGAGKFIYNNAGTIGLGLGIAALIVTSGPLGMALFAASMAVNAVGTYRDCSRGDKLGCALGFAGMATGGMGFALGRLAVGLRGAARAPGARAITARVKNAGAMVAGAGAYGLNVYGVAVGISGAIGERFGVNVGRQRRI